MTYETLCMITMELQCFSKTHACSDRWYLQGQRYYHPSTTNSIDVRGHIRESISHPHKAHKAIQNFGGMVMLFKDKVREKVYGVYECRCTFQGMLCNMVLRELYIATCYGILKVCKPGKVLIFITA